MLQPAMMAALLVSGVAGIGMMANEASHGQMAELMGLGHNHMADYGGYHCAAHDGEQAALHAAHMHNGTGNGTMVGHSDCPGGAGMHGAAGQRGQGMHA